ncbi:hypothetical protein ACH4SP_33095 [Streptomyces sp. NPDC021093]|uniref:hypothetical protein n=1 Tax=Streptomyces sp. NPDC021093 TaxID=3365112 RepID=UPI003791C68C
MSAPAPAPPSGRFSGPAAVGTLRLMLRQWWHHRRSGSRTRRLLERHLAAALFLAVLGTGVMLVSYREIDRTSAELAGASAPAVQNLAAARLALLRAHEEVRRARKANLTDVVGPGENYNTQLSAADQGLSRLVQIQIDGARGRTALGTSNGLVEKYAISVADAVRYQASDLMWRQKFGEATSLLTRKPVGVVPRLDELQGDQFRKVETDTGLGGLQVAGWAVAELALIGLLLTILSALRVLRRRCGRRYDGWLAAALLLTAALAVLPLWATTVTQDRLDASRDELARYIASSRDDTRGVADRQEELTAASSEFLVRFSAEDWRAGAYYAFLAGGALVCVLPAVGCVRRLNADYWRASS